MSDTTPGPKRLSNQHSSQKHLAKKVLLIGWDAADWKAITPILEAGGMPNLERMINQGVMGNLATLRPMLSPMLWTSIATGKRPFKHGIHGFTEPDPVSGGVRPVTNLSRKCKAIWNILTQQGLTSNVIGWWPSHPAEPIRGVMVSNHYQRAIAPLDQPWPMLPGTVHPQEKAKDIAGLRMHPAEIPPEAILPFIPKAAEIAQKEDGRLTSFLKILADCTTVHSCATAVMQLEPWDFMAVYFDAIDHFGHGFMKYHPPRQDHISEADFEMYKGVVEGGYRYHDMMLGMLLKLAGDDTTVILMSDHGFHPDHLRPRNIPDEPAGPAIEHSPYGIFVMKGPGIKRDERIYGATLVDVTPTILTLFGLPVGQDMDGKPLLEAFEQQPEIAAVPSWEDVQGQWPQGLADGEKHFDGRHPANMVIDPVESREAIQQLVALGYVEDPGEDKNIAAAHAVRELNHNLAQAYCDAGRYHDAAPLFEQLWADYPDEVRFAKWLAHCYRNLNRLEDCRRMLEQMRATRIRLQAESIEKLKEWHQRLAAEADLAIPDPAGADAIDPVPPGGQTREAVAAIAAAEAKLPRKQQRQLHRLRSRANLSPIVDLPAWTQLLLAEGKQKEAAEQLEKIAEADPKLPGIHQMIGQSYAKLDRRQDAEAAFRKALEIDPDDVHSHFGLSKALLAQGRYQESAEEALATVGYRFFFPMAHYHLGMALIRLAANFKATPRPARPEPDYLTRAIDAFRVAVTQAPGFVRAHLRLVQLYTQQGELGQAGLHRALVEKIRRERSANAGAGESKDGATASGVSDERRDLEAMSAANMRAEADPPASPASPDEIVTIVSGLPRSGTSVMMQMLHAAGLPIQTDGEREADSDNPHGYYEDERVKSLARDASWIDEAQGKALKVIAQLIPHLPEGPAYRAIFVERDLDEVLASQTTMIQRLGRKGSGVSQERLRRVFAEQVRGVKIQLQTRGIPVLYVPYREVMEQPERIARRVSEFLGGGHDVAKLAAVVDRKLGRHRGATLEKATREKTSREKAIEAGTTQVGV